MVPVSSRYDHWKPRYGARCDHGRKPDVIWKNFRFQNFPSFQVRFSQLPIGLERSLKACWIALNILYKNYTALKPDTTSGVPDISGSAKCIEISQNFCSFLLIAPLKNTVGKKVI